MEPANNAALLAIQCEYVDSTITESPLEVASMARPFDHSAARETRVLYLFKQDFSHHLTAPKRR